MKHSRRLRQPKSCNQISYHSTSNAANVFLTNGENTRAATEFRRAIELDPSMDVARRALQMAEQRMKQQPPARNRLLRMPASASA